MISFWRQLKFLLWKGTLLKKRQPFWLSIELLVPIILFAILAAVRTRDFTDSRPQCHYDSKGFPSAGLLPFLHSFLCSFSNDCHMSPTTGDEGIIINNGTAKNESILVDFLYYGSLQLRQIGEHPEEFHLVLNEATHIIQLLANANISEVAPIKFKDLFSPSFNVSSVLLTMGLTPQMTTVLLEARPTTAFYYEAFKWGRSLQDLSFLDLFWDDPVVPFLCDPDIFFASFILNGSKELNSSDYNSLCKITTQDFVELGTSALSNAIKIPPIDFLPLQNGSKVDTVLLSNSFSTISDVLRKQPMADFFDKYLDSFSNSTKTAIQDAIFCGTNPFDTSAAGLDPKPSGVETPFDEMKTNLIKFIEKVVPGQDKHHDKTFCGSVPVHDDLNCSSLETALFRRLRPILQGYILVSPRSAVVEQLVQILNRPLQSADFFRRMLYEWPSMADDFQIALFHSDFKKASQNLLLYLNSSHPPVPYHSPFLDQIEFGLEHIFNDPSDPYSFGAFTKNITELVNEFTTCFLMDRFVIVDSEENMEEIGVCLMNYEQYYTGISFLNMTSNSSRFEDFTTYKIRHQPSLVDSTNGVADSSRRPFSRDKPFNDLKYITYGFSFLQEAVDRAIVSMKSNGSVEVGMYSQQEPYPCAEKDTFNISNFIGLFVILSFIIPASLLVKNIVLEKEQKLKEQMKIMGLGDTVHFLSWALISFALNMISVIIICLILKLGQIFTHTDFTLLLVFFSLFALSSISLSLLLSTFFSNANISTAATCIIYFLFFFPFQLSVKSKNKTFSKFTLIFPQTTLGYGTMMLAVANELEEASWADINGIYLSAYGVSLVQCLCAFVLESVGFCILSWYISAIAPGVYGVSQPFYFPFTRRYWFPNSRSSEVDAVDNFDTIPASDSFEAEPTDLKMTVNISNMSKVYDSGTKALDQLNLRLYESNITALLGHNGAGKTTTMSLLCGLYSPTSGAATVYGRNIRTDMRRVRDVLGVCPQYNVLFPLLTVSEQLRFFAALKGTPDDKLDSETANIIESVCLSEKKDCLASTLSGGMKRRLCIGIALIGNSKFVILDEPTAGVDVNSRKDIWKLLQNNKEGRTILLSTHHMDEADVLSDRVAVLSEGGLVALGSPVFLKNRYGECLQLATCKMDRKMNYAGIIERIIVSSKIKLGVLDETDDEIVFSIPIDTDSADLQHFFEWFDTKLEQYKFADYGISAPTLQQIFVRLTPQREYVIPQAEKGLFSKLKKKLLCGRKSTIRSDEAVLIRDAAISNNDLLTVPSDGNITTSSSSETLKLDDADIEIPPMVTGWEKTKGHIHALLSCRWHYTRRSKKTTFFEVVLPVLLLLACELYALVAIGSGSGSTIIVQNPLPLIAGLFGNETDTYVNVLSRNTSSASYEIMNSFITDPGMGTRCAKDVPYLLYGIGCARNTSSGNFNWTKEATDVNYNEELICECTNNLGWNCTQEDYPLWSLDRIELNTTDRIWDMSFKNISQMRMDTRWSTNSSRHRPYFIGGYSMGHLNVRAQTKQQIAYSEYGWTQLLAGLSQSAVELRLNLSGITANSPLIEDPFVANMTINTFMNNIISNLDVRENVKVWFNNKIWPSLPIYAGSLSNALLRIADKTEDESNLGIITINHPINSTVSGSFDSNAIQKVLIFRITIIVLVLSVIPAGFTVFLVEDRISDSYHLQLVSGLAKKTYWLTGYLFDMGIFCLAILSILLIYLCFGVKDFTNNPNTFFSFFLLFLLYGLSSVLWAYCLQRRFTVPALSFVLIAVGTFFVGIVASMTVIIIEQLMQTDPTLELSHTICSLVFLLLPQYCLGMAIFRGSYVYQLFQLGENFLEELNRADLVNELPLPNVLEWNLMGMYCAVLFCHCILAALLLAILEHGSFGFLRRRERSFTRKLLKNDLMGEEEDIVVEQKRVDELKDSDCPLIVNKLAKAYSPIQMAVRGISFAVERGECFGLLGLNGAGKTTTFGMLTGKIFSGSGSVVLNGFQVGRGDSMGYAQLGYCPQFDALNIHLTTQENMIFFSRIRGIPETLISSLVFRLLKSLHLRPYADTVTASLSGGNKRKLSVAIALISQPALILLDEPSAGMDPGSQQFLWKVIEKLRRSGKAVVMTSHSMEECEALCTRIAIMDKGKIRCLGSKQHLKNKFGEGYSLTLKMHSAKETGNVVRQIKSLLPASKMEAVHCSTIFFRIDREEASIAIILHAVNEVKKSFEVEDFSLSQATLGEVFQSLATRTWALSTTSSHTTNSTHLTEQTSPSS